MEQMNLLLAQREALLASDEATLAMLHQLDRQLLTQVEHGGSEAPVGDFSEPALDRLLAMPLDEAVLWFEITATLTDADPAQAVETMVIRQPDAPLVWWLAAHNPAVPVGENFPEASSLQVWAALAHWRRGRAAELPEPWRHWADVLSATREPSAELLDALWEQGDSSDDWKAWFYPLLTRVSDEWQLWMVNWLSARADTLTTVEAMGISCARRFLGWLEAILAGTQENQALVEAASRELRWLKGDQPETLARGSEHAADRRDQPPAWWGRQAWGGGLHDQDWQRLLQSLPLAYRNRCWYWRSWCLDGGPGSLFGGRWCAGS